MTEKNNFNKCELFNIQLDVWIDEEDYQKLDDDCIELGKLKSKIDDFFKNKPSKKSFNEFLTKKSPIKSIKINGNEEEVIEVINGWQSLFLAKYLRAKIMEKGTDDFEQFLDDLVMYLQRKLPYQSSINKEEKILLQHLYLQELSACGKAGPESLGFALQAESILKKIKGNLDENIFDLYGLWAKINQGVGYAHSKQMMEALKAYDEIIKNFPGFIKKLTTGNTIDNETVSDWQSLIYDQAVLPKAEVLEELQFSYHTIKTLSKLKKDSKKEHRLIKEASAYQDMGRLEEAKCRIEKFLGHNGEDSIEKIFEQFDDWDVGRRKKRIWSKTLGLLFDYYLQKFKEQRTAKDVKFLVEKFNSYKKKLMVSKPERVSYYQQVARYLEWLATESYEYEDLYSQIREELPMVGDGKGEKPKNERIDLNEFGKYEYDRFTDSMEKFFRKVNDLEKNNGKMQYREDEKKFLNSLNKFEKGKYWLYKFKELERQQRIDNLDSEKVASGKEENEKCPKDESIQSCFACEQDSLSFDGILECAQKRKDKDTFKLTEYYKTGFKPMEKNDYEVIMRKENDRFLDYLKFRSRHSRSQSEENSYHFMGLQRWNSQTPTLTLSQGGGYFIYKQDKEGEIILGIAIDPGFDFVDNLFHMGFTLNDIDFILISHAHLDHMRDFEPIISSLLDLKKREPEKKQKKIHVMMSLGVYHKLKSVITNTTLREYLADTYIVDIDKETDKETEDNYLSSFKFKKDGEEKFASILNNDNSYEIEITPTKAYHDDYSEQSDSFGYILKFKNCINKQPLFSFGYTGDTKWNEDIPSQYNECDVVCIHLGALIESEEKDKGKFSYYKGPQCESLIEKKGHPYLFGLLRLLKEIKNSKNRNRLILISEFGEELKGGIRIDLIHRLNQIFKDKSPICLPVDIGLKDKSSICLPVDIGLNVMLAKTNNNSEKPKIEKVWDIWCFGCDRFVEAKDIGYRHFGYGRDEALFYFCKTCLKSKPENVIQEKMRDICEFGIPLQKAE